MRVEQKIFIFGAVSLNKIFSKICRNPIISWFLCDPPISHEKILWPPAFSCPPPIRKKMIAPLISPGIWCILVLYFGLKWYYDGAMSFLSMEYNQEMIVLSTCALRTILSTHLKISSQLYTNSKKGVKID